MSQYNRHKVFISFHHEDQAYKDILEQILENGYAISKSVQDGDIQSNLNIDYTMNLIRQKYLNDSTVTIVLVGKNTWKRKYIDWEIHSSLRNSSQSPRSGLLALILPTHKNYTTDTYDPYSIPPRLYDNTKNGYAHIFKWTTNANTLSRIIDEAFERRVKIQPTLTRTLYANNRSEDAERWQE